MKPKFTAGKEKKQSKAEASYDFYADVQTVIYQIVSDLKEKSNDELRVNTQTSWKDLQWCNAKMSGKKLMISIEKKDGSLRMPRKSVVELQKELANTRKELDRFETALRSEFRKRTGKALTWVNPETKGDFQMIAHNGLHLFVVKKFGDIKTTLPGQKFDDE